MIADDTPLESRTGSDFCTFPNHAVFNDRVRLDDCIRPDGYKPAQRSRCTHDGIRVNADRSAADGVVQFLVSAEVSIPIPEVRSCAGVIQKPTHRYTGAEHIQKDRHHRDDFILRNP